MFRKWLEIIFDHKISLRERMFRLVTGISMVALVFILVLGRSGVNLFILPLSLAYIYIAAKISIKKECINAGAAAIVVLLLLLYTTQRGFLFSATMLLLSNSLQITMSKD